MNINILPVINSYVKTPTDQISILESYSKPYTIFNYIFLYFLIYKIFILILCNLLPLEKHNLMYHKKYFLVLLYKLTIQNLIT